MQALDQFLHLHHVLSWIVFSPMIGLLLILCTPSSQTKLIRGVATAFAGLGLVLGLALFGCFYAFHKGDPDPQFQEVANWITFGWGHTTNVIQYAVGVDGISITLVLLTSLVSFLACIASFGIDKMVKGYFILFLLLLTGMQGVFVSFDFFLFFVFWEVMLLPMYFLIGIWGGPRREYAAIKFFLFTMGGSVFLFLGMLALFFEYLATHGTSAAGYVTPFNFHELSSLTLPATAYWKWVWWGMFVAFIVKVPSVPVHTWLPDAHVEAPTPISVILAGILLKMGGYGIIRVNLFLMPGVSQEMAHWMGLFGVVSIVYGALCAMAQQDFKKLVAYASVSSMGFVTLGIATSAAGAGPAGINGAIFQMFAHGLYSSMLFLLVGVIYDRAHHRDLDGFGGLAQNMPLYAGISGVAFMTALGLPGLCVFISEAMVLIGAWRAGNIGVPGVTDHAFAPYAVISATAVIITAAYMLWTVQRVFLGKLNEKYKALPDLSFREQVTLIPLAIGCILFGFYPAPLLTAMGASVSELVTRFGTLVGG